MDFWLGNPILFASILSYFHGLVQFRDFYLEVCIQDVWLEPFEEGAWCH